MAIMMQTVLIIILTCGPSEEGILDKQIDFKVKAPGFNWHIFVNYGERNWFESYEYCKARAGSDYFLASVTKTEARLMFSRMDYLSGLQKDAIRLYVRTREGWTATYRRETDKKLRNADGTTVNMAGLWAGGHPRAGEGQVCVKGTLEFKFAVMPDMDDLTFETADCDRRLDGVVFCKRDVDECSDRRICRGNINGSLCQNTLGSFLCVKDVLDEDLGSHREKRSARRRVEGQGQDEGQGQSQGPAPPQALIRITLTTAIVVLVTFVITLIVTLLTTQAYLNRYEPRGGPNK